MKDPAEGEEATSEAVNYAEEPALASASAQDTASGNQGNSMVVRTNDVVKAVMVHSPLMPGTGVGMSVTDVSGKLSQHK